MGSLGRSSRRWKDNIKEYFKIYVRIWTGFIAREWNHLWAILITLVNI